MGDAAIWVYWGGVAPLYKIPVPQVAPGVSSLQIAPVTAAARAARWSGAVFIRMGARYDAVRLVIEGVSMDTEPELYRDLRALEEHLKGNEPIAFALDESRAWASYVSPVKGSTTLAHTGNDWAAFNSSATLSSGDSVVIRSMGASGGWREEQPVSTFSSTLINFGLGSPIRFLHPPLGVSLVRHEGFWPLLRLQESAFDRPLLTVDQGRTFTFAAELYEDTDALSGANGETQQLASVGDDTTAGRITTSRWSGRRTVDLGYRG
jgi:hypothetical protein